MEFSFRFWCFCDSKHTEGILWLNFLPRNFTPLYGLYQKEQKMDIKFPLYNILNMFLTGFVFLACVIITLYPDASIEIVTKNAFINLSTVPEMILLLCFIASSYVIGLIINRVGSIVIEPILIKMKFLSFSKNYALYTKASNRITILHILSREYALSRTSAVEFIILAIWSICINKFLLSICYFTISIIFLFSCKKHSAKISTVVKMF